MPLRTPGRRRAGFTLVELLAATTIALVTALGVTSAVVSAQHAVSRSSTRAQLQGQAASVLDELGALSSGSGMEALLDAVFPHAQPGLGGAQASFSDQARDGRPPGTFFTRLTLNGASARVAATFVSVHTGGWSPVPLAALAGYAPATPPSGTLLLHVTADAGTGGRALETVVRASDVPADPLGVSGR